MYVVTGADAAAIRERRQKSCTPDSLAPVGSSRHPLCMYVVTEADAAAIRTAYETGGELSAAIELRRRFPGISDNAKAREQARAIAGWTPPPERPAPRRRSRRRKAAP